MKTLYIMCIYGNDDDCTISTVSNQGMAKFISQSFKLELVKKWQQYLNDELINVEMYSTPTN